MQAIFAAAKQIPEQFIISYKILKEICLHPGEFQTDRGRILSRTFMQTATREFQTDRGRMLSDRTISNIKKTLKSAAARGNIVRRF